MKLYHYWLAVILGLTGLAFYGAAQPKRGVTNPNVYQANIGQTICVSGWTATVRPPTSYTTPLKANLCLQQHCSHPENFELDHFVPIELGGAPSDPNNLWLEPYPEAHNKDRVENYLKSEVCNGKMSLVDAQKAIYHWQAIYQQLAPTYGSLAPEEDPDDI